jgi:hypothetical protein
MFQPESFHERRPGLVAPVRVDPSGTAGPTRGEARGPRWRTTSHGLVVPADVERSPGQRIVEAAAVLRPGEAVTGWAALHWLGGTWFEGATTSGELRAVPLVAQRHLIAQVGYSVSQEFLGPWEVMVVDGLAITLPVRSVVFEMRYAAWLGPAVEALDMACFSDLVSLAEVAAYLSGLGAVTGIPQAREAHEEGDENAWSPREVMMRRVWIRSGLSRPLCNTPVFTLDGRHVGTPDLFDPASGLAGDYDGSLHLAGDQRARDVRREGDFRGVGLEYVTMVAADARNAAHFTGRLLNAHARALASTAPRRWTVEPPDWWTPTVTVEQRRNLDEWQKRRWLRHRRAA